MHRSLLLFIPLTFVLLTVFPIHAQVGKVGINTNTPAAMLHVMDSSVIFTGLNPLPTPGNTPISGAGTRMMWYPDKAAFRAGTVTSTHWNKENIGLYSVAMGYNTKAKGDYSTAMGYGATASGLYSIAIGGNTTASGGESTAMGGGTIASGEFSTAMGGGTIASGHYSTAMGFSTTASEYGATALGGGTTASGLYSLAIGASTTASEYGATALGAGTFAIGLFSTAMGEGTLASGAKSTAMGEGTIASGLNSTAMGNETTASGDASTAMGFNTKASGNFSTTMGQNTKAIGSASTSIGNETKSKSYASLALGQYNDSTFTSSTTWMPTDPVFIIGNGSSSASSNAMTVLKNGKTGINVENPSAMLHVADSSVLFTGFNPLPATPANPPVSGAGTRMMWYPDKAAFRAGKVSGTFWNKDNVGLYSIATGLNTLANGYSSTALGGETTASGSYSTALGYVTTASGQYSTAMGSGSTASSDYSTAMGRETMASGEGSTTMGFETIASNYYSTAMGSGTTASGSVSTTMGSGTTASGNYSIAMGIQTTAKSYASLVIGRYNDLTSINSGSWNAADPVFIIGNGMDNDTRTNAMTVLKNGNVGIGSDVSPNAHLHISKGTGGGMYNPFSSLIMEDDTSQYIQFSNTNNSDCGIRSGNSDLNTRSAILFFADSSITFRAGGNSTKMTIENNGFVGIGITGPAYQLHVSTNSAGKPTSNVWTVPSDARLKTNVQDYTNGLSNIMKIRPVWFTYTGEANMPRETGVGIIAQELQEVAPYMVGTWNYEDENGNKTEYLSVDNGAMTYMLINAVKEQQARIDALQHELNELKQQIYLKK